MKNLKLFICLFGIGGDRRPPIIKNWEGGDGSSNYCPIQAAMTKIGPKRIRTARWRGDCKCVYHWERCYIFQFA